MGGVHGAALLPLIVIARFWIVVAMADSRNRIIGGWLLLSLIWTAIGFIVLLALLGASGHIKKSTQGLLDDPQSSGNTAEGVAFNRQQSAMGNAAGCQGYVRQCRFCG